MTSGLDRRRIPGRCGRVPRRPARSREALARTGSLIVLVIMAMAFAPVADAGGITGFFQRASPHGRSGIGFGLSVPVFTEILSLEGEYSRSQEEDRSPSLTMWSGNLLLTSPISVVRLRPYLVFGMGMYRQSFLEDTETSLVTSRGLGLYVHLSGPARLRFDYRAIHLQGDPLQEDQKRFYGGLNLQF